MLESNKKKKPTKAELEAIVNTIIPEEVKQHMIDGFAKDLKDAHIKGLIQGFELANQMLLEYGQGKTIEEVLEFCKKNIEDKTMSRLVSGEKELNKVIDTDNQV